MRGLLVVILLPLSGLAGAHELGTAVFDIQPDPVDAGRWRVQRELPVMRRGPGEPLRLDPGPDCQAGAVSSWRLDERRIHAWDWQCKQSWSGRRLRVSGLAPQLPDALIRIRLPGIGEQYHSVNLRQPDVVLPDRPEPPATGAYFRHGLVHIASGWDHLLFVLLLFWCCRGTALLWALTGFTGAHAFSLAGVLLLGWRLPAAAVETLIALSLSLLAAELIRHQRGAPASLALRRPALMAFAFGLVHGLGFAGALLAIGLPDEARIAALALFNLGIEAGQLLLAGALAILAYALRGGATAAMLRARVPAQYAIGVAGMVWALDRYQVVLMG